jgi:hypothetical protein
LRRWWTALSSVSARPSPTTRIDSAPGRRTAASAGHH